MIYLIISNILWIGLTVFLYFDAKKERQKLINALAQKPVFVEVPKTVVKKDDKPVEMVRP